MPRSEPDDEENEWDDDCVDEDAELELSCALHDLAERVKTFEENMKGRLRISGLEVDDDEHEEIGEDLPEVDDDDDDDDAQVGEREEEINRRRYGYASPKRRSAPPEAATKKTKNRKTAKQQDDDDDDSEGISEDDSDDDEGMEAKRHSRCSGPTSSSKHGRRRASAPRPEEWDDGHEQDELCELQHNIAKLLQGMQEQARALAVAAEYNQ